MALKFDTSKLVKELGNKYKLIPYIDKVWETFDEPFTFTYERKKGDYGFHPSGMCHQSVRELYDFARAELDDLELAQEEGLIIVPGLPERLSPAKRKAFMTGHYWHQVIQYIVCQKLNWCAPEDIERRGLKFWGPGAFAPNGNDIRVSTPFHYATGSGDITNCTVPDGWNGIVDIKTMSSAQFKKGLPDDKWGGEYTTAEKYEMQVNIYMDFFDKNSAIILTVNKDSPHQMNEFLFDRNQELIDEIYGKWQFVSQCLDAGVAPTEEDDALFSLPTRGPTAL